MLKLIKQIKLFFKYFVFILLYFFYTCCYSETQLNPSKFNRSSDVGVFIGSSIQFEMSQISIPIGDTYVDVLFYKKFMLINPTDSENYKVDIENKRFSIIHKGFSLRDKIYNDLLLLYDRDGRIDAYDLNRNQVIYQIKNLMYKSLMNIHISGNYLFFIDIDGNIIKYDLVKNKKYILLYINRNYELWDIFVVKKNFLLLRDENFLFLHDINLNKRKWSYRIYNKFLFKIFEIKNSSYIAIDFPYIVQINSLTGQIVSKTQIYCIKPNCNEITLRKRTNLLIEDNHIIHVFSNNKFIPFFKHKEKIIHAALKNNILYIFLERKIISYKILKSEIDLSFYKDWNR